MKVNYQLELDRELEVIAASGKTPRLLLHSCCGPCSSYVLEYLSKYFEITILYYNPNIYPKAEYDKRAETQRKLLSCMKFPNRVNIIFGEYFDENFYEAVAGLENEPEGGLRCEKCFELRLGETAKLAKAGGFDYFATTLTVSPHKDAQILSSIGGDLAERYGVKYLYSDFKKRDGYKRSVGLSAKYGLYRQDYCGCRFSYYAGHSESAAL